MQVNNAKILIEFILIKTFYMTNIGLAFNVSHYISAFNIHMIDLLCQLKRDMLFIGHSSKSINLFFSLNIPQGHGIYDNL